MIAIILICDGCEDEGYPGMSRTEMKQHGWVTHGSNMDLCETCHGKLISGKPVTKSRSTR